MTDTVKIPIRVFTSYELLTEYYGDSNLMELGMYEDGDTLVVGHAPNAYSFNPQYFTGETQYVPNYVPDSPFTPPTEEPTTEAPTEAPTTTEAPSTVATPTIEYAIYHSDGVEYEYRLAVKITCETEGATIKYGWPEEGVVPEYYDYYGQLESPRNTVEIDGEKYLILGNAVDECIISAYGQFGDATSETVTKTYTPGSIPTPTTEPSTVADPVLTFFLSPVEGEDYVKLCVNVTCETAGATTYLTISSNGTDMGPYNFELWKQMGTVEKNGVVYVKTVNLGPGVDMSTTATISSYAQLNEYTSSTVTATATYE